MDLIVGVMIKEREELIVTTIITLMLVVLPSTGCKHYIKQFNEVVFPKLK